MNAAVTDRQAELKNCNFVKTVLMLIVVLYHCMVFWTGTWFSEAPVHSSGALALLSLWMNSFHVYSFALVSGYLFYYLKHEREAYQSFLPFILNKAKRLLIPYVCIAAAWVIPFSVAFFHYDGITVFFKYLLGTSPSQLWFLLMLFGVFVVFYPLSSFFQKHLLAGMLLVAGFYGVGIIGQSLLPDVFQVFRTCSYIPFFWLGFKIRQLGSCMLRKVPVWLWLFGHILLFALVRFLVTMDGVIFELLRLGVDFVLHIIGALMAFIILQKIADHTKWQENKAFLLLGKYSMPVYLFHQQIVCVFLLLLNGVLNPYVHVVVNFVGAMVISLLLSVCMMRFKWTRILIGEK